jgi:hypothetical protein
MFEVLADRGRHGMGPGHIAIRMLQGAGGRVLAVESAAAVAILGIALATRSWTGEGVLARAWIPLAASLVAFACLAL